MCLSLSLKVSSDDEFLMSAGNQFQTDGAEDRKPRNPMTVFVRGTESVPAPVDLNERPGTYGVIKLAK